MKGNIAIITARGGSKRIHRKTLRNFLGKPIIAYSIEAALMAGCFEEVMVSTDDAEIAALAKDQGANVPFMRSEKSSGDHATTADVISEVLSEYRQRGKEYDNCCCIYPTAPFVTSAKLAEALELLNKNNADSVFPVTRFSYPIQRALNIKNSQVKMIWPENLNARSQDLEPAYHDVGQFYWISVKRFEQHHKLFSANSYALIVPESETQDIDHEEDWKMAEMKYRIMQGHK
jgi:pseudaminic acid cytidylyltransferase